MQWGAGQVGKGCRVVSWHCRYAAGHSWSPSQRDGSLECRTQSVNNVNRRRIKIGFMGVIGGWAGAWWGFSICALSAAVDKSAENDDGIK